MKRKLIITGSIVLSLLLVSAIAYFSFENVRQHGGVTHVKIIDDKIQGKMLVIGYDWLHSDSLIYSVRVMDEDELIWYGWEQIDDEGTLGKYRYEIKIGDVELSSKLWIKYPGNETHILMDVPRSLKSKVYIRLADVDHASRFIYLGSDEPLGIEELDGTKTSFPSSKLRIKMNP